MSNSNILALVEALRKAGLHTTEPCLPPGPAGKDWCPECGHIDNSKEVDAAAKALVAEIERLPEFDCAKCTRTECPHSGKYPARPGPSHGCSSFKGGPT